MRAPNGLATLRQNVADYFANPQKFLDFSKARHTEAWDEDSCGYVPAMIVPTKTFQEVTGLVKLGSGSYSDVYAIDETRVLKIVKTTDTGYARFVEQCRKYPSNPHFPKVHYSGVWGGKTVYVLERLSANPETGGYELSEQFRVAVNYGENPFMTHASKHIAEVARVLMAEKLLGDLHGKNLMFRGNVPVVTDPCAE